jgi:alkanesulfonate monooxygenase SsuD/methylene tetrahydromethanopterin reductase-like flavin-dependent oxidoreductase (luciferase family)
LGSGALIARPDGRAVLDRSQVRPIDHTGRFFEVAGPLNVPPLSQRRPVQFQAGQSEAGRDLGARYAEVVFTSLPTLDVALDFTRAIRRQAEAYGCLGGLPLIFSLFHATHGATQAEVRRIVRGKREAIDLERGRAQLADTLGGEVDLSQFPLDATLPEPLLPDSASVNRRRGRVAVFSTQARTGATFRELIVTAQDTGHWAAAGTPEQLADAVEERFRVGVITLSVLADPGQHDFAVNGLLEELRKTRDRRGGPRRPDPARKPGPAVAVAPPASTFTDLDQITTAVSTWL